MADEKHAATWTDDCQGKKDFDGEVVIISSRYWPGYATVYDSSQPDRGLHEVATGRPSAKSSILLRTAGDNVVILAEMTYEADTEADVKAGIEAWVDRQFARVVKALRAEFGDREDPSC